MTDSQFRSIVYNIEQLCNEYNEIYKNYLFTIKLNVDKVDFEHNSNQQLINIAFIAKDSLLELTMNYEKALLDGGLSNAYKPLGYKFGPDVQEEIEQYFKDNFKAPENTQYCIKYLHFIPSLSSSMISIATIVIDIKN